MSDEARTIGEAIIAIRDARAPWFVAKHFGVLVALASRLPNVHPTAEQIAADARMHRSTALEVLKDLRERGLISYSGTGGRRANTYTLNLTALNNLALPTVAPGDGKRLATVAPGDRQPSPLATVTVAPGDCSPLRVKEESKEEATPRPPAPSGLGSATERDAARRVVGAYATTYREARGVDPTLNGVATKAATALVRAVGLEGALLRVSNAGQDPWWRERGTLGDVARHPDRYATMPQSKKANGGQPLPTRKPRPLSAPLPASPTRPEGAE